MFLAKATDFVAHCIHQAAVANRFSGLCHLMGRANCVCLLQCTESGAVLGEDVGIVAVWVELLMALGLCFVLCKISWSAFVLVFLVFQVSFPVFLAQFCFLDLSLRRLRCTASK